MDSALVKTLDRRSRGRRDDGKNLPCIMAQFVERAFGRRMDSYTPTSREIFDVLSSHVSDENQDELWETIEFIVSANDHGEDEEAERLLASLCSIIDAPRATVSCGD